MATRMKFARGALLLGCVALLAGCPADQPPPDPDFDAAADRDARTEVDRGPALELEVNLAARELYVIRNGQRTETHPVAVGTEEWPTRTGEWTIDEVVFNPRWVPPDEEWAEDEDEIEAGDPENPLGVAQLVYDRPRSIHGTNEPNLIGQAVSHGSIRVHNDVAMELARQAMEAGGVTDGEARIREAEADPETERTVRLERGIPIRVR
jgi:lipoprotein-anchoring transpeptidase ErfK/SrfK